MSIWLNNYELTTNKDAVVQQKKMAMQKESDDGDLSMIYMLPRIGSMSPGRLGFGFGF